MQIFVIEIVIDFSERAVKKYEKSQS